MQKYNWNYPTTMWVGENRINDIAEACKTLNISKPLLVTDKGLADTEIVKNTLSILTNNNVAVALYSNVVGNPTGTNVYEGVESYKKNKCDGVIAFGGGSGLDVGKAIAFMSGQRFSTVDSLYNYLTKNIKRNYGVYVNKKDAEAGAAFIESFPTSSKYKEKMENALAVLKYLNDLNSKSPIKQVYWGYRAKPEGIPASHKGDLFVEFKTGEMLGVSLKAGGDKTREPQLNTYVNKFFADIGYSKEKDILITNVYNKIHKSFGLPRDWMTKSQKSKSIDTIEAAKEKDSANYEKKYDEMLDMIRDSIISAVNKNKDAAIDYIVKQVLKKDENVPLVVVKAVGTKYKMVTDEDALDVHLPTVTAVRAYKSDSSKQNWFIDLVGNDTITMNMSVRSNKPVPDNKIAQGFNLAIKFNGI